MQLSNQYNSFLGGEVSESLWYRADMDKFGKWFANAENIRFTTMGSFTNRPGFVRVGPVLDHQLKPVVKLIPFVFNNEEVFEIEFITGKFRVRKHGEVIKREDGSEVVYDSPIKIESLQQLKYAQSGDIIFIASGTSPVMELRRLKTDGTEWELVEFKSELPPFGEENHDKEKTVKITSLSLFKDLPMKWDLGYLYYTRNNYMVDISYDSKRYRAEGATVQEIAESFNSQQHSFEFSVEKETVLVAKKVLNDDILEVTIFFIDTKSSAYAESETADSFLDFPIPDDGDWNICGIEASLTYTSLFDKECTDIVKRFDKFREWSPSTTIWADFVELTKELINDAYIVQKNNQKYLRIFPKYYKEQKHPPLWVPSQEIPTPAVMLSPKYSVVFNTLETAGGRKTTYSNNDIKNPYILEANNDKVYKKNNILAIKNIVQAGEIKKTQGTTSSSFETDTIFGHSKWRYYTSGNWKGEINIYYSNDSGETWKKLRTSVSNQTAEPGIFNENTSGTIEGEEVLKFKIQGKVSEGSVNINFYTDTFDTFSYYKIVEELEENNYLVSCIKNDVGVVDYTEKWKEPVFSDELGYPESIGFYQNRLFIAKGYELWGSKINDFWDFYEPIDLQKDDPINMSILTYKVNTIKNILTTKSFFVFTTGGEFGIASQGAISQDDKFLKQFSSHGSNDCTPLVVGNIVLFVDSTGNTVRAFQYSFESDNYEATDISLFIEQKLKGKQIITTEYIRSTKECLFLDADGIIWVFKYMPEQNIMSWSHWKHGRYKITNLCVTPNGAYDELYVVVDAPDGKFIERLDSSVYSDSVEIYTFEENVEELQTQLVNGTVVNIDDGVNNKYKATVDEDGKVKLRSPSKNVKIGLSYISIGTLLTPTISLQDGSFTTYRKQRINKVFFVYRDSFGFKVGEEGKEKMEVEFNTTDRSIEESTSLASGKKSVLIPDTYDSASRVSFVQDEPYPMHIVNVLLESDYGGQ